MKHFVEHRGELGFWIDETAKTVVLADGMPLTVRRFDGTWISATRGDMSYEVRSAEWQFDLRKFDYERGLSDDHNRVRALQHCSRSGGLTVKFGIQQFRYVPAYT